VTARRGGIAAVLGAVAIAAWFFGSASRYHEDLPAEFAGKRNPLGGAEAIAAGGRLFQENCASCHGDRADGHGPASVGLDPPPADFRSGAVLARHSDAYLYYRVSTGKPGTAMPSFHGALGETQRWEVVSYLRSLAAGAPAEP
jgi:mono/diheme cytochrome c family protein